MSTIEYLLKKYSTFESIPEEQFEILNEKEINLLFSVYFTKLSLKEVEEGIEFFDTHPDVKKIYDEYNDASKSVFVKEEILKLRCDAYPETKKSYQELQNTLDACRELQEKIEKVNEEYKEELTNYAKITQAMIKNENLLVRLKK